MFVALSQMCRWLGVAHRTVYFRSIQVPVKVRPESAEPSDTLLEQSRRFSKRTVARISSTTHGKDPRIFRSMGGQGRKHEIEHRSRHEVSPSSVATAPDQRLATYFHRVWRGWLALAWVIECHSFGASWLSTIQEQKGLQLRL